MKKMKKIFYFVGLAMFVITSCNTTGKKTNSENLDSTNIENTEVENKNTKTLVENKGNTQAETPKIVKIEDIKKGDQVCSFIVKKVEYQKGYMFNIETEGKQFEVTGNLQKNEFEETLDFYVDKESLPETKILVEGSEYNIFKVLNFRNPQALLSSLPEEQKTKLNNGETVDLTVTVNNLIFGVYMDKGRLDIGSVEFVK